MYKVVVAVVCVVTPTTLFYFLYLRFHINILLNKFSKVQLKMISEVILDTN